MHYGWCGFPNVYGARVWEKPKTDLVWLRFKELSPPTEISTISTCSYSLPQAALLNYLRNKNGDSHTFDLSAD
jgi:hypothetical protein